MRRPPLFEKAPIACTYRKRGRVGIERHVCGTLPIETGAIRGQSRRMWSRTTSCAALRALVPWRERRKIRRPGRRRRRARPPGSAGRGGLVRSAQRFVLSRDRHIARHHRADAADAAAPRQPARRATVRTVMRPRRRWCTASQASPIGSRERRPGPRRDSPMQAVEKSGYLASSAVAGASGSASPLALGHGDRMCEGKPMRPEAEFRAAYSRFVELTTR